MYRYFAENFSNAKSVRSDQRVEKILSIIILSRTCYKSLVPVQQQQYKQQINKTNCIGVSQGQIRTRKRSQPTNHVRKKVTNHDWILVGSFWPYPASCCIVWRKFQYPKILHFGQLLQGLYLEYDFLLPAQGPSKYYVSTFLVFI